MSVRLTPVQVHGLEQGTPAWGSWRSKGIGSSDASAIMGVSPYQTMDGLWQIKTGRMPRPDTSGKMRWGQIHEAPARFIYEFENGVQMEPACFETAEYPWLRASTDGWNGTGIEIKCLNAKDHGWCVTYNRVLDHYVPQVQHQMLVCNVGEWEFVCFHPKEGFKVIHVERDDDYIERLLESEIAFMESVKTDTPPLEHMLKASLALARRGK